MLAHSVNSNMRLASTLGVVYVARAAISRARPSPANPLLSPPVMNLERFSDTQLNATTCRVIL